MNKWGPTAAESLAASSLVSPPQQAYTGMAGYGFIPPPYHPGHWQVAVMYATLKVIHGSEIGRELGLSSTEVYLGRGRDCDIVIEDASASRRHARLLLEGDAFTIEDLKSTNRTYVNGAPVVGRLRLKDQDLIRIGETQFLFKASLPAAVPKVEGEFTTVLDSVDAFPGTDTVVKVNAEAKLRAILQITQALDRTLDLGALLDTMLEGLFDIFPYANRALVLMLDGDELVPRAVRHRRDEEGSIHYSKTIVDRVMGERQAILSQDIPHDDRFPATQSIMKLRIRSVMCVPLLSREKEAIGVIQLEAQREGARFDSDDVQILASVAHQMSIFVDYVGLHKEALRQSQLQRELDFAEEVQRDFLPKTTPEVPGYAFWPYYLAAGKVGGDYYDFLSLPNGNQVVLLGDVSGKGVPAALRMAKVSTVCKVALLSYPDDLGRAVGRINREICDAGDKIGFVTLAVCVVDPQTHEMTIANAGHLAPLLRQVDGTVGELIDRNTSGCPLGIVDDYSYETARATLNLGDAVVLLSDGISEARNRQGELYSIHRVREQLAATGGKSCAATGEALMEAVGRHTAGSRQNDDISLVVFGREGA